MYVPAVVPQYQQVLRPVDLRDPFPVRRWPVYQPPRWRCDNCGQEQLLPDHTYHPDLLPREDHRCCWNPPYPAGWFAVRELADGPQYMPAHEWHYCCSECYDERTPAHADHG